MVTQDIVSRTINKLKHLRHVHRNSISYSIYVLRNKHITSNEEWHKANIKVRRKAIHRINNKLKELS